MAEMPRNINSTIRQLILGNILRDDEDTWIYCRYLHYFGMLKV